MGENGSPGEIGDGRSTGRWGKREAGSWIPKVTGTGKNKKIFTKFHNNLQ